MKSINSIVQTLFLMFILTSCNSSSTHSDPYIDNPESLTEEELKQQLLNTECTHGASYLSGTLNYKPVYKNALSMKVKALKLSCTIKNKATIATLKDIKAKVIFKSKTGAEVLKKTFDIYEFIKPAGSFKYKTEIIVVFSPPNTNADIAARSNPT